MIETQIGQLYLGGKSRLYCLRTRFTGKSAFFQDDISFAIVIELKDDASPAHSDTAVCINMPEYLIVVGLRNLIESSPMDSSCNTAHNVRHFRRCRAPYDSCSQHGCYQRNIQLSTLLQHSDVGFQLSLAVQESAEKISREERAKRAKNVPVVDNNIDVSKSTIIEGNSKKKIEINQ